MTLDGGRAVLKLARALGKDDSDEVSLSKITRVKSHTRQGDSGSERVSAHPPAPPATIMGTRP